MNSSVILLISTSWLIYFIIHSLLAMESVKHSIMTRSGMNQQGFRFLYVILATVLLIIPLWLTFRQPTPLLWHWQGITAFIMNGIAITGIIGFLFSMKYYDGMAFLGLKPFNTKNTEQAFVVSPLHRFVRHPQYFFSLLIIWSRDMSVAWLITCIAISLYFILGSMLEEKKLVLYYGDRYRQYQQKVPGLFPLPWKYIHKTDADKLMEEDS